MAFPAEKERYNLADALAWSEQDRIELIDGYPVMMAPPTRAHQKAVMELSRQLANYLAGKNARSTRPPLLSDYSSGTRIVRRT